MALFEVGERSDQAYRRRDESCYLHLNRSARAEFQAIRELLESWFREYPEEHAAEVGNRFRSTNDRENSGAFFELFLHRLLSRLNAEVQIHPPLQGRDVTPDFKIIDMSGRCSFLEARVSNDPADYASGAQKRRNRVLAIIDAIPSPDFILSVTEQDQPGADPPKLLIETSIRNWLETLSWRVERDRMVAGTGSYPERSFDFGGHKLTVEAVARPKQLFRDGMKARTLGATAPGIATLITPGAALRKAVKDKASKYGELAAPFILALNVMDSAVWSDYDVFEALFGDDQIIDVKRPDGRWESVTKRTGNGAFLYGKTPQNTRLSGVLAFRNLYPWSLTETQVRLFLNPWAQHPYEGPLSALPSAREVDGHYLFRDGHSVRDVLALPDRDGSS